jgi:hypothetical protein
MVAVTSGGLVYSSPAPPLLVSIARLGGNVLLSWPAPSTGYGLQQNTNLATTNWTAVLTTPGVTNGQNQVLISPPTGKTFYRLKE